MASTHKPPYKPVSSHPKTMADVMNAIGLAQLVTLKPDDTRCLRHVIAVFVHPSEG